MDGVFLSLDHTPFMLLANMTQNEDGSAGGPFRKEVIKLGMFYKESDDLEFEITPAVLNNWVFQFHEMKKNGVKVPVPLGHSMKTKDNRGWVKDLFVDGDTLVMTAEIFDKDVANLVKRNDVSLFSPSEWSDTQRNTYVRPIRHIALTPWPVIPGLDEFRPLAASHEKDNLMDVDLKKLGADIGITDELTEKNAPELILSHCASLKDASEKATKKIGELGKQVESLKDDKSDKNKPVIDDTLLSLAHDNREMKLDALVTAGKITPAVRDKLKTTFIGDDNDALRLCLETKTADVFDGVIKALIENDPVKLGEQTRGQHALELSDPNKGVDANVLVKDAQRRAEAVKGKPGWGVTA